MQPATGETSRVLAGRYRLGPRLGRGGMAEVYDGHDERLDRPVAVKLLRPEMAANHEVRRRFEVEARAAARLSHPNVVAVYDTGEDGGVPFIVMERLPGESVADRIEQGPVEEEWVRRMAGDVLGALGAAHAAGLVHRDVKPANILIGADDCAKVADFGIAKSAEAVAALDATATGQLLGTPAYLAPERFDGQPATPQSDLYSLGVVLYEALAGTKPFTGPTPVAVAHAVHTVTPPTLTDLRPSVDPALAGAVAWTLAKDPARRPASAHELAAAIGISPAHEGNDDTLVAEPAEFGVVGADGRRGKRWLVAVALGLLAVLGVALAAASSSSGGNSSSGFDAGEVSKRIRELAARVENGDGPRGGEAARRLRGVAGQVEAGGGALAATDLLRDVAEWNRTGQLSGRATIEINALLNEIPGVDAGVVVPTTTSTTVAEEEDEDGGKDRGKGRGKDED